jgi:hypothetical protein
MKYVTKALIAEFEEEAREVSCGKVFKVGLRSHAFGSYTGVLRISRAPSKGEPATTLYYNEAPISRDTMATARLTDLTNAPKDVTFAAWLVAFLKGKTLAATC